MSSKIEMEYRDCAFNKRMLTFAIVNHDHIEIKDFLSDAYHHFEKEIVDILDIHLIVKVNTCFNATFEKVVPNNSEFQKSNKNIEENVDGRENYIEMDDNAENNDEERKEKQTLYIHTASTIVDTNTDLHEFFMETVVNTILKKVDDAIMVGSGFTLSTINELVVQVNRCDPIKGSSYIPLPKHLTVKHSIVNVKNIDSMCFKWSILSALYPASKHCDRVSSYLHHRNSLNFTGIDFPVKVNKIDKFEQINPEISVNVYIFDEKVKKVQPLRITKKVKRCHVDLLLLTKKNLDKDNVMSPIYHYCWIKSLSRLISSQISKHNGQIFLCNRCLNHFDTMVKLDLHRINCNTQNKCEIEMPTGANDTVEFKNTKNQMESPFIIYADVEALLKKPTEQFVMDKEWIHCRISTARSIQHWLLFKMFIR